MENCYCSVFIFLQPELVYNAGESLKSSGTQESDKAE